MCSLFLKVVQSYAFLPIWQKKMHKNVHFVRKRHDLCNKKQEKRPTRHPLEGQVERMQGD